MFGKNNDATNSLKLELHPENFRAIFSKMLKLILGIFLFVLPATGLAIYFLYESAYLVYGATAVSLISFVAIIYWSVNSTKSVYQVDISPTGFSMLTTTTSAFAESVNGWYRWEDIAYYTYDVGDESTKLKLILYLNSGQCLSFYYLGLKETGDLPNFYHILRNRLPEKERKL